VQTVNLFKYQSDWQFGVMVAWFITGTKLLYVELG